MKGMGIVVYIVSLFLLYPSTDLKVALILASVSLSVLYVWTLILWMVAHRSRRFPAFIKAILPANLAVILTSAFVIGLKGAVLLFVILSVLYGFVLLVNYGLRRGSVVPNASSRLKYFGILLLGFFCMNPLIEGVLTSNWVEVFAVVMLVFGGYLMFEEIKNGIS